MAQFLKPYASSSSLNIARSRTPSIEPESLGARREDVPPSRKSVDLDTVAVLPPEQEHTHRRLVMIDPVAVRYLEEDVSLTTLAKRVHLSGYEVYVVEQWACSRSNPIFVICTYTGDMSRSIVVSVLSVPSDESAWSPRLRMYSAALKQNYNREKDTPLGTLTVTNLNTFPSVLSAVFVPNGDPLSFRLRTLININLKRMSSTGRAALNLQPPPQSTVNRFRQLYRIADNIPVEQGVLEVVRLVQIALSIFDLYPLKICDGLLCDITEKAVLEWWKDIGSFFYNVEPQDGILGPPSVAAILGLLVGAHGRLKAYGTPAGKDPLDPASMQRAIGHFQKSAKLEKTRYLDRITLDKLHRATAKSVSGEGMKVGKAVKSTVAELGGKGGEMVLGMVGGHREKKTIADFETMDIQRLAEVAVGPKMKWIWRGKPMKATDAIVIHDSPDSVKGFIRDEPGQPNTPYGSSPREVVISEPADGNLKRADTTTSHHTLESRSGLGGRLRDAVGGMKPNNTKMPKEEDSDFEHLEQSSTIGTGPAVSRFNSTDHILKAPAHMKITLDLALAEASATPAKDSRMQLRPAGEQYGPLTPAAQKEGLKAVVQADSPRLEKIKTEMRELREELKGSQYQEFNSIFQYKGPGTRALRRSQSAAVLQDFAIDDPRQHRVHHRLSFSIVENTILTYSDPVSSDETFHHIDSDDYSTALSAREALLLLIQRRAQQVFHLQRAILPFTEGNIIYVEDLARDLQEQLDKLNDVYYSQLDQYQTLREQSQLGMAQERGSLEDSLRRMEMLGSKLDYELGALQSRVQEVEDGVNDFERSVQQIENQVQELIGDKSRTKQPWFEAWMSKFRARRDSF